MNDNARQAAALGAMVFIVGSALVVGTLSPPGAPAADAGRRLQQIEDGTDHIDAATLAAELMAAPDEVVLVDVRPAVEYAAWHLPSAVNMTVPEVAGAPGQALFDRASLVVLCSNGATHPAQAWSELRRQGRTNVRVLDGGLDAFKLQILTPPSLRGAPDETQSKAAASAFALRRAFFLGDPRPSPLQTWATDPRVLEAPTVVSAAWLHARLGEVAVVDVRENAADYAALHVPGALYLPVASLRTKTGNTDLFLLPPERLAEKFGALGLAITTPIAILADDKMQDATLAALAFLRCGHRALAILEGGLLRWATERRPLVAGAAPAPNPASYVPRPGADDFTIGIDELGPRVRQGATTVLDVRPADFFRGDKSTEARPGHIPGAVNRTFTADLERTADGLWFKPRARLEADYAALGIDRGDPVVVSCRTGHQASQSYFVLRWLLGRENVRWYNGSWTEWAARSDLPAELGERNRHER
ncbi:MAG TPA: rhodanese-like domain-containing protein [Planctomycetota bacterium]